MSRIRFLILVLAVTGVNATGIADEIPGPMLKRFREEFVRIAPGEKEFPATFTMGSADEAESAKPAHDVTLADSEWFMHRYEMTQELYEAAMGENPSRWKGKRNSAEQMTVLEAIECCERLTAALRKADLIDEEQVVRLPTEVEWEYCCRAGTSTPYSFGDKARLEKDEGNDASLLDPYAWHTGNAAGNDPEVGVLKPNPWGLYDMHGYLGEFVLGEWQPNYSTETTSEGPTGPEKTNRSTAIPRQKATIRGGSWKDDYAKHTSATRRSFPLDRRDDAVGFRCVLASMATEKQP